MQWSPCAPFNEDGFLGPGTSWSNAADRGIVDMSGMLHFSFIELLVGGQGAGARGV